MLHFTWQPTSQSLAMCQSMYRLAAANVDVMPRVRVWNAILEKDFPGLSIVKFIAIDIRAQSSDKENKVNPTIAMSSMSFMQSVPHEPLPALKPADRSARVPDMAPIPAKNNAKRCQREEARNFSHIAGALRFPDFDFIWDELAWAANWHAAQCSVCGSFAAPHLKHTQR